MIGFHRSGIVLSAGLALAFALACGGLAPEPEPEPKPASAPPPAAFQDTAPPPLGLKGTPREWVDVPIGVWATAELGEAQLVPVPKDLGGGEGVSMPYGSHALQVDAGQKYRIALKADAEMQAHVAILDVEPSGQSIEETWDLDPVTTIHTEGSQGKGDFRPVRDGGYLLRVGAGVLGATGGGVETSGLGKYELRVDRASD